MRLTSVTLEKVDSGQNMDKFYRVFYPPTGPGFGQWGSQRNGRTGGQVKMFTSGGEAIQILGKKRADGYIEVESREIDVDSAVWNQMSSLSPSDKEGVKSAVQHLENAYVMAPAIPAASQAPSHSPSTPDAPSVAADRIQELSNKYLEAIGTASGDPIEGYRILALLGEELEPLLAELRKLTSYQDTLKTVLGVNQ